MVDILDRSAPSCKSNRAYSVPELIRQVERSLSHLLPKHSMISPVRVDLLLLLKAIPAAFLSKADAAMQPNSVGFIWLKYEGGE